MRIPGITLASALLLAPYQLAVAGTANTQDVQVNLTVTRFEDHISIQCRPKEPETSGLKQWALICNELALAQANVLVAEGAIETFSGPVYDASTIEAATTELSRSVALKQPRP